MAEDALAQRVLVVLSDDPEVLWVTELSPSAEVQAETGTERYVIGCRDREDSAFGKMLFIIALGDLTQQLNEWSLRRLQDCGDVLTGLNHSSASGLWWGWQVVFAQQCA